MSRPPLERKVGWFVLAALTLLAVLLLQFSKGTSLFRRTYALQLVAANVGGIKARTSVFMAGVPVGSVSGVRLAPDGRSVTITLKVYRDFIVYNDARFVIEQSGFLGDQFVSIIPTGNRGQPLRDGDTVQCEEPFNLQEVARSAAGFIKRLDATAQELHDAIARVDRVVLNETTLGNLAASVGNARKVSEDALVAVSNIQAVVDSGRAPLGASISNVNQFSLRLNSLAGEVGEVVATNAVTLSNSLVNVESASASLKRILANVEAGRGLAGTVLTDAGLATNVTLLASNLAVTSSNLNRLGLWGILWSKRPARADTNAPAATTIYTGRDPTR